MSDAIPIRVKALTAILMPEQEVIDAESKMYPSYAALLDEVADKSSRINTLEAEIEGLRDRIESLDADHAIALETAVEVAREEERNAISDRSSEIVNASLKGLELSQAEFQKFLENSEMLALELLDDVINCFDNHPEQTRMFMASAIKAAVAQIGTSAIVNVRISAEDFDDAPDALIHGFVPDVSGLSFELDPDLETGRSVFELLIGTHEISLKDHWSNIRELIRDAREQVLNSGDLAGGAS